MTEIYQIWYDERQIPKLLPYTVHHYNPGLTIFFENDVIPHLVKNTTAEKVGVCSWKLGDKMRKHDRENLIKGKDGDFQVLGLTRNSSRHQMLAMLYNWHPRSKEAMELIWTKLGYKIPTEPRNPFYQNHYLAKTEIYRDYVDNFLIPAMELTEKDEQLLHLMRSPSNYGRVNRQADIKRVKMMLGMDDYPLATFVLERCPPCWMQMKGYKVSYL